MSEQIKIVKCKNSLLWYHSYIGKVFTVVRSEKNAYWVRELEFPFCINWIYKDDVEVV